MKMFTRKRDGFTLIEMTIVLFIISLLVLIIIPNISNSRDHAEEVHKNAMVSVVQTQLDNYLDDHSDDKNDNVSLNTLNGEYLTQAQYDKANKEGIEIKHDGNNSNKYIVTK